VPHYVPKSIACCHQSDFCNRLLSPMYEIRSTTPDPNSGFGSEENMHYLALLVSVTASLIILIVLVTYVYIQFSFYFSKFFNEYLTKMLLCLLCRYKKKEVKRQDLITKAPCVPYLGGNSTIKDMVDHSQSSGSGSGLPLLVQNLLKLYL